MRRAFFVSVLAFVAALTIVVLLSAFLLPEPASKSEALLRAGYRPAGVRFMHPRFDAGGLRFDRVESFERGEDRHQLVEDVRRVRAAGRLVDRSAAIPYLVPLLASVGLQGEVAADGSEIAVATADGILWKRATGQWQNASGGEVPESLRSLDESVPIQERLAHPERMVWVDAAIETFLREGVRARVFADALVRRRPEEELLVRLLIRTEDAKEIARVVLERNDDGLLQLRLLTALGPRALPTVCARPWPQPSPYLRQWLLETLEDGTFEALSDRESAFDRMREVLDASFRDRLLDIVRRRNGASCAAAYLILRRIEGVRPDPSLAEEAKRWASQ